MAARPPSSAIGGVVADEHVMVVERRFAGQAAGQAADAADAIGRRSARSGGSAAPAPAPAVGAGAVPALAAGQIEDLASASPPALAAAASQSSRRALSGAPHSVSPLAPAASGDASPAAQAARDVDISCESTTPPPACGGATFGIDNYNDSDKDYCGDSDGDNYGDIDNDDYVDNYADSDTNHCGGSDGDNNGDIDNDNYDDGWSWHTILLGAFLGAALNLLVEIVETVMARCGASPTPWVRTINDVYIQAVIVPEIVVLTLGCHIVAGVGFNPRQGRALVCANIIFWVSLMTFVGGASAVTCGHCLEEGHHTDSCPFITGVAANVAAIAAGTYTTMKLSKLLPPWLLHLFPATALQMLVSLAGRNSAGEKMFDYTGKKHGDILRAVRAGLTTVEEAVDHVSADLDLEGSEHASKRQEAREFIRVLEGVTEPKKAGPASGMTTHGHYRYILARVQGHVMDGGDAALYKESISKEEAKGAATHTAKYKHPKKANEFFEMVHLFQWTTHALGVMDVLVVSRFLQAVVYEPMRRQGWSWQMVYCYLLAHFEAIENSADEEGSTFTLGNIVRSGGSDTKKDRAMVLGGEIFGSLFESGGSSARDLRNISAKGDGVKGNPKSTLPCHAWNNNQKHSAAVVASGQCSFRHGCGQVLGKGADGKDEFCFMDHRLCHGCKNPKFTGKGQ